MKIILFQPQIPQNAGNIVRTCSVTNTGLVMVRPFGFSTSRRQLKRAGLDYWNDVLIEEIDDLPAYLQDANRPFYFFSSKTTRKYTDFSYENDALLIFGNETAGLPPVFREKYPDRFATLPMKKDARCLNLANSAAIALYEALRQQNFSFAQAAQT